MRHDILLELRRERHRRVAEIRALFLLLPSVVSGAVLTRHVLLLLLAAVLFFRCALVVNTTLNGYCESVDDALAAYTS